jgi:uncharacterized protein
MTISMYSASIPVFILALTNLSDVLSKGEKHAEAKKFDPTVLINGRLAPDMFPLSRQVQIATDIVKGGAARLAGVELPSFPDTETTFSELQARIQKTIDFLKTLTSAQIDGTEEKPIALKVGGRDMSFKGLTYLLTFVLPNLYFHSTVAYSILRHNGVDVGKADFLGKIQ